MGREIAPLGLVMCAGLPLPPFFNLASTRCCHKLQMASRRLDSIQRNPLQSRIGITFSNEILTAKVGSDLHAVFCCGHLHFSTHGHVPTSGVLCRCDSCHVKGWVVMHYGHD